MKTYLHPYIKNLSSCQSPIYSTNLKCQIPLRKIIWIQYTKSLLYWRNLEGFKCITWSFYSKLPKYGNN